MSNPQLRKHNLVYIAGPFRGKDSWEMELNIRKAEALSLEVWKLNEAEEPIQAAVICPHTNTRFFQGACHDDIWLDGLLAIMERCDFILLVEGWEKSEGTIEEIKRANELDIPVFKNIEDLKNEILKRSDDFNNHVLQTSIFDVPDEAAEPAIS